MKKYYFILCAATLVVGALHLASCSKDDEPTTPQYDELKKLDDLKIFQNYLVEIDTAGNFIQRFYGEPLDAADTTQLTVYVETLDEAQKLFQNWCQNSDSIQVQGSSLVFNPTDENGKTQGTITFNILHGQEPTVAEITFSTDLDIKHVSHVAFELTDTTLESAETSPYLFGDFVYKKTEFDGMQDWVCIREAKKGTKGLLVYVSKSRVRTLSGKYGFASGSMAMEVSRELKKDWDNFVMIFCQARGNHLGTYYYWTDDTKCILPFSYKRYAIVLYQQKISKWETWAASPLLQYLQVETFDMK